MGVRCVRLQTTRLRLRDVAFAPRTWRRARRTTTAVRWMTRCARRSMMPPVSATVCRRVPPPVTAPSSFSSCCKLERLANTRPSPGNFLSTVCRRLHLSEHLLHFDFFLSLNYHLLGPYLYLTYALSLPVEYRIDRRPLVSNVTIQLCL